MAATQEVHPYSPEAGVWIAIPAYDEARAIRAVVQDALAQCPRVIVVDDGSRDGTASRLHDLPVTILVHEANRGKADSLRTAFAYALSHDARCVITLDGDGQHDPADVPALLSAWRRHDNAMVIGARLHDRARFPPARYRANRFACFWISWAAGHAIADSQSGFRVYPREVMRIALDGRVRGRGFTFESEILIESAWRGHPTVAVTIPGRYPPTARPSHFRPVIDIAKIVVMVAGRLLRQGMAPMGLWRSRRPPVVLPGRSVADAASGSPGSPRNVLDVHAR
jgi:glycosyltransferase involved in cell wall biosynthesis